MKYFIKCLLIGCLFVLSNVVVKGQVNKSTTCPLLFPIENEGGLNGYINNKGEIVVKPQFVSALDFNEGVAVVWTSNKETGYVDLQGKLTLFSDVVIVGGKFSEGLALAERKGEYAYFVDMQGRTVFKLPDYQGLNYPFSFSDELVAVKIAEKFYFVNRKGELAISQGFDEILGDGFIDGVATVSIEGNLALIDRQGNYIIAPQEGEISNLSDGLLYIKDNEKWKYIDKSGKTVLQVSYDRVGNFNEGVADVLVGNKWGYINKNGKFIVCPKFSDTKEFSEGLAAVEINNQYGFINKKGEVIISPTFDFIHSSFKCGLAYVQKNDIKGYINMKGEWIWKQGKN